MTDTLYRKAIEVSGITVVVYRGAYAGMTGEVIEVGPRDGGMHHGCVKIKFTTTIPPDWQGNEQWFLSGYLEEIREVTS